MSALTPSIAAAQGPGRLIYLVGPSGAGKDSVLAALLQRDRNWQLAPRYITRAHSSVDDRHYPVDHAQFERLDAQHRLALSWRANGFLYGIDIVIDDWLRQGIDVLANGSRAAWPAVRRRYPDAIGVQLNASPEVLRARLVGRGRDQPAELEERLRRNEQLARLDGISLQIDGDGSIEAVADMLLDALQPALSSAPRAQRAEFI